MASVRSNRDRDQMAENVARMIAALEGARYAAMLASGAEMFERLLGAQIGAEDTVMLAMESHERSSAKASGRLVAQLNEAITTGR